MTNRQMTITPPSVFNVTPIEKDVFNTIAAAAQPSAGLACAAAHAYVELITAGRYGEIGALFSSNAIFSYPDGNIYHGPAEITSFYSYFLWVELSHHRSVELRQGGQRMRHGTCIAQRSGRRISFERHRPFTVDESGKIARMVVYLRPAAIEDLVSKPNQTYPRTR